MERNEYILDDSNKIKIKYYLIYKLNFWKNYFINDFKRGVIDRNKQRDKTDRIDIITIAD